MGESGRVRIDKWLWAARFFKTRSLALQAIELGRVRIEGERVKPAREARIGETVTVQVGEARLQVTVRLLSAIRGPASSARQMYEETPESLQRRERRSEQIRFGAEPARAIKGRPTKRDRRVLTDLNRSEK